MANKKKKDLWEEVTEEVGKAGKVLKGLALKLGEEAADVAKRSEVIVRATSKKLKKEAVIIAKRGEEKLSQVSRIGKLSLDIVGLKRKKEDKFQDIGNKVYQKGLGKVSKVAIEKLCQEARKIDREIKKKEKEIRALKAKLKKSSPKSNKSKQKK